MTNHNDLSGRTTVVVGASLGLGCRIARAFAEAGAPAVAVARNEPALAELATTSANIRTEVADAADATVAPSSLDQDQLAVLHPGRRRQPCDASASVPDAREMFSATGMPTSRSRSPGCVRHC